MSVKFPMSVKNFYESVDERAYLRLCPEKHVKKNSSGKGVRKTLIIVIDVKVILYNYKVMVENSLLAKFEKGCSYVLKIFFD